MAKKARRPARHGWIRVRSTLVGGAIGILLVGSAVALASSDGENSGLTTILYALSELAVDTEVNAHRIVELTERLGDLEQQIEALEAASQAAENTAD